MIPVSLKAMAAWWCQSYAYLVLGTALASLPFVYWGRITVAVGFLGAAFLAFLASVSIMFCRDCRCWKERRRCREQLGALRR